MEHAEATLESVVEDINSDYLQFSDFDECYRAKLSIAVEMTKIVTFMHERGFGE